MTQRCYHEQSYHNDAIIKQLNELLSTCLCYFINHNLEPNLTLLNTLLTTVLYQFAPYLKLLLSSSSSYAHKHNPHFSS